MSSSEAALLDRIRRDLPGVTAAVGVNHQGPWARVGDVHVEKFKGSAAQALEAALEKALSAKGDVK